MVDAVDSGNCSPEQNAAGRGHVGPCGNATRMVLAPGKYAIFGDAPEGDPATGRRPPMAVLVVTP
jgi:hypothetical protein